MTNNKNDALRLLRRAKSNLNRGRESDNLDLREICIEDLCFDLQQSSEKALKSILLFYNIEYPKTHDISKLITLLDKNNIPVPEYIKKAVRLTPFAVETRYVDDLIDITDTVYKESLEIAENVYGWAKEIIDS